MAWLETYTGVKFDLVNPKVEQVDIIDIAHVLSKAERFANHLRTRFTVAQHSIICAKLAEKLGHSKVIQLYLLTHDFSEAYIVDVPRPLKNLMTDYKVIENKIQQVMYNFVGLSEPTEEEMKIIDEIDNLSLFYEAELLTRNIDNWSVNLKIPDKSVDVPEDWFYEMDREDVMFKLIGMTNKLVSDIKLGYESNNKVGTFH